jgi:hypothetical protein
MNTDILKTLSIFHYCIGIYYLLLSLSLLFYLFRYILSDPSSITTNSTVFGFVIIVIMPIFLLLLYSIGLIALGYFLEQKKRYWFSFIFSFINCLAPQFGAMQIAFFLGIITIIVLWQKSTKTLYGLSNS